MTTIDNIMTLADQYATQRQHAHYLHETDARQALRAAIEQSLKDVALSAKHGTPGEPVAIVVDAYDTPGLQWLCQHPPRRGDRLFTAPQPQPKPKRHHVSYVCPQCYWTLAEEEAPQQERDTAPATDVALLRQALEALAFASFKISDLHDEAGDGDCHYPIVDDAITALRERLVNQGSA